MVAQILLLQNEAQFVGQIRHNQMTFKWYYKTVDQKYRWNALGVGQVMASTRIFLNPRQFAQKNNSTLKSTLHNNFQIWSLSGLKLALPTDNRIIRALNYFNWMKFVIILCYYLLRKRFCIMTWVPALTRRYGLRVLCMHKLELTHWGREIMTAIFQTTFWNAHSWMKVYEIRFRFHWNLLLTFEFKIF